VVDGAPVSVLLPLSLVDAVRPTLNGMASEARCEVDGSRIRIAGFEGTAGRRCVPGSSATGAGGREDGGTSYEIVVLGMGGELTPADEGEWAADQDGHVAVSRGTPRGSRS
jgi:hypothetical protein